MWDKPALMLWLANLLYAVAAILLLYAVLFLVVHLPLFPLREVKVNGELKHVTREQVQFIVTRALKGNFFTLDLNKTRAHLREAALGAQRERAAALAGPAGSDAGRASGAGALGQRGAGQHPRRAVRGRVRPGVAGVQRARRTASWK